MTPEITQALWLCLTLSISMIVLCPVLLYCLPNRHTA